MRYIIRSAATGQGEREVVLWLQYAGKCSINFHRHCVKGIRMWIKKFRQMLSSDASGRNSHMRQITRMVQRPSGQSGSAVLWSMVVLAVLVIVVLALLMGRGKEQAPVPALDVGSPAQVQKSIRPDVRSREEKRLRPPMDTQRRPDRAHRPPPPAPRRPGDPLVPPPDPRERQRALQNRYDSKMPAPGKGAGQRDQQDAPPGAGLDQDGYGIEADVAGTPDQVSPS